jgi:hypothetical protein
MEYSVIVPTNSDARHGKITPSYQMRPNFWQNTRWLPQNNVSKTVFVYNKQNQLGFIRKKSVQSIIQREWTDCLHAQSRQPCQITPVPYRVVKRWLIDEEILPFDDANVITPAVETLTSTIVPAEIRSPNQNTSPRSQ